LIYYILIFALVSYVLGSIPFSYIAGRLLKGIDLREHGSGNLGATNTYRLLGIRIALTVGILDALKGFIPVILFPGLVLSLSRSLPPPMIIGTETVLILKIFFGLCGISGHIWTLFLGFKGGKGVTTAFGVFMAIAPFATLASLLTWALVLHLSKTVSVSSIATAVLFPIFLLLFRNKLLESELLLFIFSLTVSALVIYTHRSNIARLLKGEEKKIGMKER
jgi:glycerol-3-phosphate acyltransferase PlsY